MFVDGRGLMTVEFDDFLIDDTLIDESRCLLTAGVYAVGLF